MRFSAFSANHEKSVAYPKITDGVQQKRYHFWPFQLSGFQRKDLCPLFSNGRVLLKNRVADWALDGTIRARTFGESRVWKSKAVTKNIFGIFGPSRFGRNGKNCFRKVIFKKILWLRPLEESSRWCWKKWFWVSGYVNIIDFFWHFWVWGFLEKNKKKFVFIVLHK